MINYKIFTVSVLILLPLAIYADKDISTSSTKDVEIKLPKVPEAPKVVKLNVVNSTSTTDRDIKFSKRVPPNYKTSAERYGENGVGASLSNSKKMVGSVDKGRISTYIRADLIDIKEAKEKLKKIGFEIISVVPLNKSGLTSIVFTNGELKKLASKKDVGYLGTLRLLIDPKNKQISINNPLYLAKAFLGKDFNEDIPKKVLSSLVNEFKGSKNSLDKLKFQLLPNYQFMEGMPHFKDYISVANGSDLKAKLKGNSNISYIVELPNGSLLAGVKLSDKTMVFIERIGTNNAGLLPYQLLIEDNEAKILDPKYYLGLMYPQLSMEGFMSIAMIPASIKKDCENIFK